MRQRRRDNLKGSDRARQVGQRRGRHEGHVCWLCKDVKLLLIVILVTGAMISPPMYWYDHCGKQSRQTIFVERLKAATNAAEKMSADLTADFDRFMLGQDPLR